MQAAVIFSVTIFSDALIYTIDEWLKIFESKFKDCDFYFGVNSGTKKEVIDKIKAAKINKIIIKSPLELYATSDASGFQAALFALKNERKKYDYYWFGHTKGGVNPRESRRKYYISEFFNQRDIVEKEFLEKNIGVYGLHAVYKSSDNATYWDNYSDFFDHGNIPIASNINFSDLTYEHVNTSFVETFFIINGKALNWFIETAKDEWFFKKINNRYYFETVFPWLASRYGMSTYIKNRKDFLNPSVFLPKIQFTKKI
jgi:hypothetical protein